MITAFLLAAAALCPSATAPADRDLVIITTERIRHGSTALDRFVQAKEVRGFRVLVATERDFGAEDAVGLPRARAIRGWLRETHPGPGFVLLVGDAHPDYGDVPFWTVWPRHSFPPDNCGSYFATDCRFAQTDYLYADLDGDWDLNRNGRYGETGLDDGPGGIDYRAERFVGRIPVTLDDLHSVDRALEHAIDYMETPPSALDYRTRALLAASYFYFRGQEMAATTVLDDWDGAATAEAGARLVFSQFPEVAVTRLYEQEGVVTSRFASDRPLTNDIFVEEWRRGQGMVFWLGHGLYRRAVRTIWSGDPNGDGIPGVGEIGAPLLVGADDADRISSGQPAFVVPVSCEVGSVEVPGSLSGSLLQAGAAIGLIVSTSITPGSGNDYSDPDAPLRMDQLGADNLGLAFFQQLLEGAPSGQAMYEIKAAAGNDGSLESAAAKMMLNYIGDPSLTLFDSSADAMVAAEDPPSPVGCSMARSADGTALPLLGGGLLALASNRRRKCLRRFLRRCHDRSAAARSLASQPGRGQLDLPTVSCGQTSFV